MRQGQQNRRGRGRNNNNNNNQNQNQNRKGQHHHNPLMRTYQSNGPDQKIHGTPAQIAEKYMSLARDALSSGDPVLAENYLQHAEHYNRIILTYREQQIQQSGGEGMGGGATARQRPFPGSENFDGNESDDDRDEAGSDGQSSGQMSGQGGMRGEGQPRNYDQQPVRMDDRPRPQHEFRDRDRDGNRDHSQQRDRDGNRDRDRDRGFRPRMGNEQRGYGGDRPDRDRNEMRGDRQPRHDRNDRMDRPDRPDRDRERDRDRDRPERIDRMERGDRPEGRQDNRPERMEPRDRPDRMIRPERPDRPDRDRPVRVPIVEREPIDRPAPAAAERERSFEPASPVVTDAPAPVAEAVAPPRRRERFVEASSDQPEFLRRPVRRPRRESAPEAAADAPPAAPRRDPGEPNAD